MTSSPQELLGPAFPAMTWTVLSTGLGALLAGTVGITWMQGSKVPGFVGAMPVLAPVVVGLGLALNGPPIAAVGARLILPLAVGGPLALLAMFGAVATIARPPRSPWRAGLGLAAVLATAGVVVASGYALEDTFFAWFRAVIYVAAGLACLPTLAAPTLDDRPGGEAAASLGAGYALFVACGESAARALAELIAVVGAAGQPATLRAETLTRFSAEAIAPMLPWATSAVLAASTVAVIGASAAGRDPKRLANASSALIVALVALGFWFVGAPTAADLLTQIP